MNLNRRRGCCKKCTSNNHTLVCIHQNVSMQVCYWLICLFFFSFLSFSFSCCYSIRIFNCKHFRSISKSLCLAYFKGERNYKEKEIASRELVLSSPFGVCAVVVIFILSYIHMITFQTNYKLQMYLKAFKFNHLENETIVCSICQRLPFDQNIYIFISIQCQLVTERQ